MCSCRGHSGPEWPVTACQLEQGNTLCSKTLHWVIKSPPHTHTHTDTQEVNALHTGHYDKTWHREMAPTVCDKYLHFLLRTMLTLLLRGRFFSGMEYHVFLPMITTFCLPAQRQVLNSFNQLLLSHVLACNLQCMECQTPFMSQATYRPFWS